MGLVAQQGSASAASTIFSLLAHTCLGSTPACARVPGIFSSVRSRTNPLRRFRTATESALPPNPAARESLAYFSPAR